MRSASRVFVAFGVVLVCVFLAERRLNFVARQAGGEAQGGDFARITRCEACYFPPPSIICGSPRLRATSSLDFRVPRCPAQGVATAG